MAEPRPELIIEGRFEIDPSGETVTLIGSRCTSCGALQHPRRERCVSCFDGALQDCSLGSEATVWSRSVERLGLVVGKPFGVCWAEVAEGVMVQAILDGDVDELPGIGERVVAVPFTLPESEIGGPYTTFAFRSKTEGGT